ncbi:MAG: sensor histidine kinase [Usitatibacter sp.]
MLHAFLTANRAELIARCRAKVALRSAPKATASEMEHGIPLCRDQLVTTLREENARPSRISTEMGETATRHGRELLQHGFTVDQVVHDYGDLCQAITELAVESAAPIAVDEFRVLNRCLDDAIAGAVTEYANERDVLIADKGARESSEERGSFVHELRNLLNAASLARTAMKGGGVGLTGATGAVLDRSLIGLRNLIDRSMLDVRAISRLPAQPKVVSLAHFILDVRIASLLEAQSRRCAFTFSEVDPKLAIEVDRDLLFSAVGNLLQNAFKFTRPHTEVSLNAYAQGDRILIDVTDHCGGLPPGDAQKMFLPFVQGSNDKSGLGLGLSIARRAVEANKGSLRVRDIPGKGCVFTIDLPRHALPESSGLSSVKAA